MSHQIHKSGNFRTVLTNGERDWDQSPVWGDGETGITKVGKKTAGRLLDDVEHNAFPEVAS